MKGIELFDNYEEDGQLSLFQVSYDDWDEDWTEDEENPDAGEDGEKVNEKTAQSHVDGKAEPVLSARAREAKAVDTQPSKGKRAVGKGAGSQTGGGAEGFGGEAVNAGPEIRVKYCASCGKLLFVREETAGFRSECNNCGIKYFQKL